MTSPLAAYSFDEASGDILDYSGNGLHIPLTSSAARVAGHTNSGLSQPTASAFIAPASHLGLLKTPNRTVMAWVKETTAITGWVLEFNSSSIDSGSWGILFLSGQWQVQARNSSGFIRAGTSRPTDNAFHHAAGTYDGTNVRFYLDGTLVSTQPLAGPLRGDSDIFRFLDNSSPAITIDDARFYGAALSQSEIVAAMASPVVPIGRSGKPKTWSGSAWGAHQGKTWNGSSWVPVSLSGHDGTGFVKSK